MSASEDSSDKPFEPTQRKLEDARRKGEVAKSTDLFVTAAYGGLFLVAATIGANSLVGTGEALMIFLDRPDSLTELVFEGAPQAFLGGASGILLQELLPWFAVPMLAVGLMILWQKAFVVTPSKLSFKPNRLSPLANAKNKFGRGGLFEFFKSFVKLLIYSVSLAVFLRAKASDISAAVLASPGQAVSVMLGLMLEFTFIVLVISAAIGVLDFLWQRADFNRRNRMSLKEMRDEAKESEGDPYLKQERRQRATRLATNSMLRDVPGADVVIVNPTHYAVALKWSRKPGAAPECVAKGKDAIAKRIRDIAIANSIPIRHDPPTARALHASVEIGAQIDRDHYRAVAAAIRFAEAMRRKASR